MIFALLFAAILLPLALVSIRRQVRTLERLRSHLLMPSDERTYLCRQVYRRFAIGILLLGLSGMLAGTYLSGMEERADQLGQRNRAEDPPDKAVEARDFARFYSLYWISVLVLLFLVVSLAIVDLWATRRYGWLQLRRIQSENRTLLERDLAMYRQQRINDRMRSLDS